LEGEYKNLSPLGREWALYQAIKRKNLEKIEKFLQNGKNVNILESRILIDDYIKEQLSKHKQEIEIGLFLIG